MFRDCSSNSASMLVISRIEVELDPRKTIGGENCCASCPVISFEAPLNDLYVHNAPQLCFVSYHRLCSEIFFLSICLLVRCILKR